MPEIGETRKPKEIGYTGTGRYIWHACVGCGKERWARFLKGKPNKERCLSCANRAREFFGEKNPQWNGGRYKDGYGYVRVKLHTDDFFHPMRTKGGYVLEHRLAMAKHLGRNLHPWEVVHHRNGIRDDNRLENLHLATDASHRQITRMEMILKRQSKEIKQLKVELKKLKEQKTKPEGNNL